MAQRTGALTAQEKLAIMMTATESQRNLAALVGVSHQRIGRWLREGEDGGVIQIPSGAEQLIDSAFEIHTEIATEQSKVDRIPFDSKYPIFQYKKPRRDGKPSDRVFIDATAFIREDLRQRIMASKQKTHKFATSTVESVIDTDSYVRELAEKERAEGRWKGLTDRQLYRHLKQTLQRNDIIGKSKRVSLYTPRTSFGPVYDRNGNPQWEPPNDAAQAIESELMRRHAPSANAQGGILAKSYIFQLMPQYVFPNIGERLNAKANKRKRKK